MTLRRLSPRIFQVRILALIGILTCPVALAGSLAGNLPDLGDESAAILSPQEERRIGEDFMRQARAQLDLLDDPELNEYLATLGQRLTAGITGQPEFRLFLVNNASINAFAVPGGYIGVHTGLLLSARNESELAAVLAHETAHITQRHIPRMIAESQRVSGPALAAMLAGILIAASGHGGGEAAVLLTTAGMAQHEINFTRGFEEEADRIGMNILDHAEYDARAMPGFFEQMEVLTRLYDNNLPEFLRSHPITGRRTAESRNHAEGFPHRSAPDAFAFNNMQARLAVLINKPADALKQFHARLDNRDSTKHDADQYGYALALLASGQLKESRRVTAGLLKTHPNYPPYSILRADIEIASGNKSAGLKIYSDIARQFPDSLAVTRRHASALLKNGQAVQAQQLLNHAVRQRPQEPALHKLLASAAGESGNKMEAHRAFGEYYDLTGQPRAAIEQFELAIRFADKNFYYVSSLQARIKEIRETLPPVTPKPATDREKNTPPGNKIK